MGRITIVEDALDDAEVFDILLTSAGHMVQRFTSGIEFLESFRKGTMDLILLDIGLPEVDGYEVFDRAKLVDAEIPIIAVTAYAYPHDVGKILRHGFTAHIAKPISDFNAFLGEISRCLRPPV